MEKRYSQDTYRRSIPDFKIERSNILRKFSMEKIATQNMLIKTFYNECMKNIKHLTFTGRKLGATFQITDKTEMKHNCDIVY